jgi:hypothetical protein
MTFPVPPDVRTTRDFELILGQDELLRKPFALVDPSESIDVGEWVKPATSGGATKMRKLEAGDVIATPARGCKVSWTKYRQGDTYNGQADAVATGTVDVLAGTYEAKTKLYNTGGTFAPGHLLVPVYDATLGGILDAPTPGSMTIAQLQSVVARVVEVAGGVLHYEAPGL